MSMPNRPVDLKKKKTQNVGGKNINKMRCRSTEVKTPFYKTPNVQKRAYPTEEKERKTPPTNPRKSRRSTKAIPRAGGKSFGANKRTEKNPREPTEAKKKVPARVQPSKKFTGVGGGVRKTNSE